MADGGGRMAEGGGRRAEGGGRQSSRAAARDLLDRHRSSASHETVQKIPRGRSG